MVADCDVLSLCVHVCFINVSKHLLRSCMPNFADVIVSTHVPTHMARTILRAELLGWTKSWRIQFVWTRMRAWSGS